MQKYLRIITLALAVVVMAACTGTKFLAAGFDAVTRDHKKVAVLPFEMVFTGKMPKDMTQLQKQQLEEAESKAFQRSLYNALLNKSGSGKKDIKITFQPIEESLELLTSKNVSLREAWTKNPKELATLLGVDAVVKTKVTKNRYLSDLASYGINVAEDILKILIPSVPGGVVTPDGNDLKRTFTIDADCQLFNGKDGMLLWKVADKHDADWDFNDQEVIEALTRKFARNFPYRN